MVTIYNSDLFKELREASQAQSNRDGQLPNQMGEKIWPVMEINPKHSRRCNLLRSANRTATGSATILTTDTIKRTFIVAIYQSLSADATADNTNSTVSMTLKGDANRVVLRIEKQTTTAVSGLNAVYVLPFPMEIEPGSAITHSSTFTVGASSYSTTIIGYTVDNAQG